MPCGYFCGMINKLNKAMIKRLRSCLSYDLLFLAAVLLLMLAFVLLVKF